MQDVITHFVAFLGGIGAGWSLRIFVSRRDVTIQKNNTAGRDITGRDKR